LTRLPIFQIPENLKSEIPHVAHKTNYLLDLEQLRVAMANSDKINSSSSLNNPCSDDPSKTNQIDDVLRQFDSLNLCPTSASVGTKHSTYKRNSKCNISC
jgi:hypothetical protein